MDELYYMVKESQRGNKIYMMKIIEKFNPLIRKYSGKLNYDDAESEIITFLIETINKMPILTNIRLKKDECIVGYINTSIKHMYISLSKKHMSIVSKETVLDTNITPHNILQDNQESIDNHIFISFLLDKLPYYQRQIIKNIFIDNISESDLAKYLQISRQSVNKAKNRALTNLKKFANE